MYIEDSYFESSTEFFFAYDGVYIKESKPRVKDKGYYGFIPYRGDLIKAFKFGLEQGKRRFLDVGSGVGNKLYEAQYAGFQDPEGVEISKSYIRRMRQLWKVNNRKPPIVHNFDALTFDYSKYDFVYMYRPVEDPVAYRFLINKIRYTLPEGALLLEVLHWNGSIEEHHFMDVHSNRCMFKKTNGELRPFAYLDDYGDVVTIGRKL